MSEEKEKLSDEIADKEEYERALAALNKSKGERVKKIVAEKKAKKQREKESLAKTNEAYSKKVGKPSFIDKCKKDPIIPACILCLAAALIFGIVRFVVPRFSVRTLGLTVDEYREQYAASSIYTNTLAPYNFSIPEVSYSDGQTVALTAAGEAQNRETAKYSYFYASIPNTATTFSTAIQGSVLKSNDEIVAIRVMASVDAENYSDPTYINFLYLFFGSYLQPFMPDVSDRDIQTLVYNAVQNINSGEFTVRQDIAYRVSIINGDVSYVAFDIMPTANMDK